MKTRKTPLALIALVGLFLVPIATDGGQNECGNSTESLTSTAAGPVNGDEAFFKLPSGPANVMFLLDTSGSMVEFSQCGDYAWDDPSARTTCRSPTLLAWPADSTVKTTTFTYTGTCAPSLATSPGGTNSPLYWMEQVVPTTALPDPGQSNALLTDAPPWGTGCVGNACLFDPKAYYTYLDWWTSGAGAGAYRRASDDTTTGLPAACTAIDPNTGNVITDYNGNPVVLGADCTTCMATHGFFFYELSTYNRLSTGGTPNRWTHWGPNPMFKGTFLNANPPKFVAAKKALKQVAWMDPAAPSNLDQVRMGLTILDSGDTSPQAADLIVPVGPDKPNAYPPTQAAFKQARQYILSVLNYDTKIYKDALGNTVCDGTTITGGFFDPANGSTPMGSALFNVGQYFTSSGQYNTLLGASACKNGSNNPTSCQVTSFNDSSPGLTNAPWARSNPNQCSICWGCQNNGIVVITDGLPNSEIAIPATITGFDNGAYNALTNCGSSATSSDPVVQASCGGSPLPRVSDWLHSSDLRADAVMSGKQAVTTHTIGLNLSDPAAIKILKATAQMSGGLWQNILGGSAAGALAAVYNAVAQVAPKDNSFSAASANSLQTVQTASSQAFLTRFKPNQSITWEGHVFEAYIFDEFLNGCDTTLATQPQVNCKGKMVSADFNGDGQCNGVFLIDKDCDPIAEDSTGNFVKQGQATPANLPWDAGQVLSDPTQARYRSADETAANARTIFTYVNGVKQPFTAANASVLLPMMDIDPTWCSAFLLQLGIAGGSSPTLTCAQQLIYFVRGWDVLDQDSDGCAGPGKTNPSTCKSGVKGEERDRANDNSSTPIFWKLGDIFHSSPAVAGVPADEIRCDTGYDKQCVATIHSPNLLVNQTSNPSSYTDSSGNKIDAYASYRLNNLSRERVVLVGSNDGMLHAFDAGHQDQSQPPDITGDYPYTDGTGEELWAFVPPDMLPRLRGLVSAHQYMVDGSVMLRDVWVDGSGAKKPADQVKQNDEFHTVAIFGRRSGGTAYSALDVTNVTNPVLLWSFPQAASIDARYMGESWNDFAPRPPPIVPVKISSAVDPRGFEERWVVLINGGYDPLLVQGRAVFMLDVWTGATLWRFTDDDFKAQTGYGSGTSMFPVAASPAAVTYGADNNNQLTSDGFFDTATWGDLGGNVFTARFSNPGTIPSSTPDPEGRPSGLVNNWYAARTFEQQRSADDTQHMLNRNEFFFMTANAIDPDTKTLRTYLGSGNREQIMNQAPSCGTDNLLGCVRAGCTKVTASNFTSFGACNSTVTFTATGDTVAYTTGTTAACGSGVATCASAPGNAYATTVKDHLECPGSPSTTTDVTGTASCDVNGVCTVIPMPQTSVAGTFNPLTHSRFYGIWAYGGDPKKQFSDPSTALAFDKNRFTDATFSGTCSGPTGGTCTLVNTTSAKVTGTTSNPLLLSATCGTGITKCSATGRDAGWFYEYGDVCPFATCASPPPWVDEKTGAGANIVLGCTIWNSFRPVGAVTSTDPCSGTLGVPVSYGYTVQYLTGTPNPTACGTFSSQRTLNSPPTSDMVRATLQRSPNGSVQERMNMTSFDTGGTPTNNTVGTRTSGAEPIYWLEVPRDLHACRHAASATACK
jgi:type IV pilus assembly protein PilY1